MNATQTIPCKTCTVPTAGGVYSGCHYSSCLRCNDTGRIAVSHSPCECDRPEEMEDDSDYCASCGARLVEPDYERTVTPVEVPVSMAALMLGERL